MDWIRENNLSKESLYMLYTPARVALVSLFDTSADNLLSVFKPSFRKVLKQTLISVLQYQIVSRKVFDRLESIVDKALLRVSIVSFPGIPSERVLQKCILDCVKMICLQTGTTYLRPQFNDEQCEQILQETKLLNNSGPRCLPLRCWYLQDMVPHFWSNHWGAFKGSKSP